MSRIAPGLQATKAASLLLMLAAALLLPGCAGWTQTFKKQTVTEKREDRSAETLREFEDRRDGTQLAAALDRYKSGDVAGAESMITSIANRRPTYYEARLRLGEIMWSRGNAAGAEPHFRAVLEAEPNRAEAHHALGLLLDGTDRGDEAREHFATAARLEPENDIYREMQQSPATAAASASR